MTKLENRDGLPDALRVLLEQYPRDIWESHKHFDGLTRFWLDRHVMFRKMLTSMRDDAQLGIDRKIEMPALNHRIGRIGNAFVSNLHGHHQMEDHHYFPKFTKLEPSIARGFDILDADHHALHEHLDDFVKYANAAFEAQDADQHHKAIGTLETHLTGFEKFLDRHLTDEEDLIVPIILKHGPERLE